MHLNGPIIASVATPTGHGYYMVGSDGGVFSFGDARFHGSTGGLRLNRPIVGIAPTPNNHGYWLVASDGGVFAFNAPFRGSMGATRLNRPVTGLVAYGNGYLMAATDGGVFDFSNTPFLGSKSGSPLTAPVVAIAAFTTTTTKPAASPPPPTTTPTTDPPTTNPRTTTTTPHTTTTVPSGPRRTNCFPSPSLCGFADATNTGIGAGVALTQVPSQATSGPGWTYTGGQLVIDGAAHGAFGASSTIGSSSTGLELADTHAVVISCAGCTVTNLKVDGVHGQSSDAITVSSGATNVTIDRCEVQGAPVLSEPAASPLRGWNGIHDFGTSTTIKNCDIHGFVGGIFTQTIRGNAKILNTFAHQTTCWNETGNNSNCPGQTGGDHCNGWATEGVTGTASMLAQDNTFISDNSKCATAATSWFNDTGVSNNAHMVLNHNLLGGDNGKPYMSNSGSPGFTYFAWMRNVLTETPGERAASPMRTYSPYISWSMYPMNASHNYDCGNTYDISTNRGGNADNAAGKVCPAALPWTPPAGFVAY